MQVPFFYILDEGMFIANHTGAVYNENNVRKDVCNDHFKTKW